MVDVVIYPIHGAFFDSKGIRIYSLSRQTPIFLYFDVSSVSVFAVYTCNNVNGYLGVT